MVLGGKTQQPLYASLCSAGGNLGLLCPSPWRSLMRVLLFATPLALGLVALSSTAAAQCPTDKVKGQSSFSGDQFGRALSRSGDELVVGAWLTVSVFVLDDKGTLLNAMDDTWALQTTLVSPDPGSSDNYGASVWIDANHLVVGAPTAGGIFGFGPGAAHIYRRVANGPSPLDDAWVEQAALMPADSPVPLGFGGSVGVTGDYAVIGALNEHVPSQSLSSYGTVHVYLRDDNGTLYDPTDDLWPEQAVVVSADSSYGGFGRVVRLDGNRLLVTAPSVGSGAVYAFWRDDKGTPADPTDDAWIEQAKVVPPDAESVIQFGNSLDFDGSLMAVGARGKAYLFRLNDNGTPLDLADDSWTDEATLVGSEAATLAYGTAVAVSGDLALVGDTLKNEGGTFRTKFGATYVFRNEGLQGETADARWTEIVKLAPPALPAQKFGATLRLDGVRAFVGEIGDFAFDTGGAKNAETGAVWPYVMAVPPWSFHDAALTGTGGTPCLMGSGVLEADAPTVASLHHDLTNAPTALVIGLSAINASFKGGLLVPQPSVVFWLATNSTGDVTLSGRWPKAVPSGTTLFLQAWTIDSQGPGGFSATNGVEGLTP